MGGVPVVLPTATMFDRFRVLIKNPPNGVRGSGGRTPSKQLDRPPHEWPGGGSRASANVNPCGLSGGSGGSDTGAVVEKRNDQAGSVARVPAPDIEALVLDGVRKHLVSMGEGEHPAGLDDHALIERHVENVTVKPQALEVRLVLTNEASAQTEEPSIDDPAPRQTTAIALAWAAPSFTAVKGIVHAPSR
jgi:hypothetical protein